jgi:hypothetical protein
MTELNWNGPVSRKIQKLTGKKYGRHFDENAYKFWQYAIVLQKVGFCLLVRRIWGRLTGMYVK